jgi:hypothetical protein
MTEKQRVKLEELIWKLEQVALLDCLDLIIESAALAQDPGEFLNRLLGSSRGRRARDRITDHLDTIPILQEVNS